MDKSSSIQIWTLGCIKITSSHINSTLKKFNFFGGGSHQYSKQLIYKQFFFEGRDLMKERIKNILASKIQPEKKPIKKKLIKKMNVL